MSSRDRRPSRKAKARRGGVGPRPLSLISSRSQLSKVAQLYYTEETSQYQIAKRMNVSVASVSRALERIRKQIRSGVEKFLKGEPGMSEAEISLCFEYAAEDAPIDFRALFPEGRAARPDTGEKGTT